MTERLMPGKVFDKIFMILDYNGNNRVSKEEIMLYFVKLVHGKICEGMPSDM